uniref:Uncharacterized protein n=1 Tax=Setaria italica TaxID=4555 RepID=K4A470_SETIT
MHNLYGIKMHTAVLSSIKRWGTKKPFEQLKTYPTWYK